MRLFVRVSVLVATAALAGCGGGAPVRAGAGCAPARSGAACSVLFLGNSYTAVNDLPKVFTDLAAGGGRPVVTHASIPGGMTLEGHLAGSDTAALFEDNTLNVVVLQEQSQIPASPELVSAKMLPAATGLADLTRRAGAEPLFLETWARRDGWPEVGITTYAEMQALIDAGYAEVAAATRADVAPAGEAWARASSNPKLPALWLQDGSHPTVAGTYLAACVLFAKIFDRSPVGLSYHAGVTREAAAELQAVAWAVAHRPAAAAVLTRVPGGR